MTRFQRVAASFVAALFLALHLPFLPPSLEDLDSINFALGIRSFDVSQHQPHPPGYPVFIVAAKVLHAAGLNEVHALSLLGVVTGAFGLIACVGFFAGLEGDGGNSRRALMATVLVAVCPLFWFTAVRPLSDMMGLAASLGVQALLVSAPGPLGLMAAAFLAAASAGVRSQVVWLTLPLLLFAIGRLPSGNRLRTAAGAGVAYLVGGALWAIPLVGVSGGLAAYLRVFYNQGAEDLTGVAMLATRPHVRTAIAAVQNAFVAPWEEPLLAGAAIGAAAVGFVAVAVRDRRALVLLLAAYGPYTLFDLVFQEVITTRYALPLMVPMAYLVARGVSLFRKRVDVLLSLVFIGACAYVSDRAMYGFSVMEAPAFRMLGDMTNAANPQNAALPTTPVLAMHRREYFDFRRPFLWVGERLPGFALRLATPPKHEWLEVVKYWNGGGREPVWFVADPLRSDLALFKYDGRPGRYRWPFTPTLLGGARPNEMDWHVITTPDWYLGEGWALTPETAGTAREDRKGPGYGPISGWVRRRPGASTVMVGGRNLSQAGPNAQLRVSVDGKVVLDETVPPGFFLRMVALPSIAGEGPYATVTIVSDNPQLAIEQFDAQPAGRVIYGFGEGWNEQEYNPTTGVLWRWSADRSAIRVRAEGHRLALTIRGEIEAASTSHITVRAGDRVAAEFDVGRTFSHTALIPAELLTAPETVLTIESSAFYVPAETRWRSRDRRTLGLKLVECSLSPVS